MAARLTFVHALSPLHAGTGQGAGIIDLPIAREKATGLPFLPGSSLKGTLRAQCNAEDCKRVFGPDTSEVQTNENHASSVQFSDQRLLLLPIRSLAGTFAWVTCPYVLRRFTRDIADVYDTYPLIPISSMNETHVCTVAESNGKNICKIQVDDSKVYLEDVELDAQPSKEANDWASWIGVQVFPNDKAWQQMLVERICIVHDDVFTFMLDTATEITARIKLKEGTKTVEDGGLWYEEALPTETILSGIVFVQPVQQAKITQERVFEVLNSVMGKTLQFGGKATVGRGMCKVRLAQEVIERSVTSANP